MNFESEMSPAAEVEIEYRSDAKEDSDECEVYSEYDSTEETEGELADGQYLNEQSPSEYNSDTDVEQDVIHEKKKSRKRSRCHEEEASTSGQNKKNKKASNHNEHESKRRIVESMLFEELAQEDEDEYDYEYENVDADNDNDDNDESMIEARVSHGSVIYDDDNSNGFDMNSLRFCKPDGTPWENEEEREAFFDYVVNKAEQDKNFENETDNESEGSDTSDYDEVLEGAKDILKFFELHAPVKNDSDENDSDENDSDESDPAEIERLQRLHDADDELNAAAKEDARKTRILIQSVYTVATVLHKFPLSKADEIAKKVEKIEKQCAEMRALLIAKGFPEDKLPPTITKQE